MAVGDVRFLKATSAGLVATTLNPSTAGWTLIAGLSDVGQSATHVGIIDNGLIRIIFETKADDADNGLTIYAFNGTAWVLAYQSQGITNDRFTLTRVVKNDVRSIHVGFSFRQAADAAMTGEILLRRGIPAGRFTITSSGEGLNDDLILYNPNAKIFLYPNSTGFIATDLYGFTGSGTVNPSTEHVIITPLPSSSILLWMGLSDTENLQVSRGSSVAYGGVRYNNILNADTPLTFWFGFSPMIVGLGDGGHATLKGNGLGALREAEDNYAAVLGSWALYDENIGASGPGALLGSIPVPVPGADINGMVFIGSDLWACDNTSNIIYKLNPATGAVISSFTTASAGIGSTPRDITYDGTNLRIIDAGTNLIYRVTTAGVLLDSLAAPGLAGGGLGLTYFGGNLYVSNINDDTIYVIDSTLGLPVTSYAAPGTSVTALFHDGTNLWAHDDTGNVTYKLNATTGAVVTSFSTAGFGGSDLHGLAWDGNQFFMSDLVDDLIYKVQRYGGIRNAAPALNHEVEWSMNFPVAGKYYIGIMAKANAGTPQVDVLVAGTLSGTPKTVLTTALNVQENQLLFGPFDVTTAGNLDVAVRVTTLSTMTALDIDFLAIYPYDSNATTPATAIMPKPIAQSLLRTITQV